MGVRGASPLPRLECGPTFGPDGVLFFARSSGEFLSLLRCGGGCWSRNNRMRFMPRGRMWRRKGARIARLELHLERVGSSPAVEFAGVSPATDVRTDRGMPSNGSRWGAFDGGGFTAGWENDRREELPECLFDATHSCDECHESLPDGKLPIDVCPGAYYEPMPNRIEVVGAVYATNNQLLEVLPSNGAAGASPATDALPDSGRLSKKATGMSPATDSDRRIFHGCGFHLR